jgi:hypothetical protein
VRQELGREERREGALVERGRERAGDGGVGEQRAEAGAVDVVAVGGAGPRDAGEHADHRGGSQGRAQNAGKRGKRHALVLDPSPARRIRTGHRGCQAFSPCRVHGACHRSAVHTPAAALGHRLVRALRQPHHAVPEELAHGHITTQSSRQVFGFPMKVLNERISSSQNIW